MDKVGRAIQRVDDPHMVGIGGATFPAFFANDGVPGVALAQQFNNGVFRGLVNLRGKLIDAFGLYL